MMPAIDLSDENEGPMKIVLSGGPGNGNRVILSSNKIKTYFLVLETRKGLIEKAQYKQTDLMDWDECYIFEFDGIVDRRTL